MTTESDVEVKRDVAYLVDNRIPYSEMTEDEIDSVIEYRASVMVEREEAQERVRIMEESMKADIELRQAELETVEEAYNRIMGFARNE